ncbi:MAG: FHA domain-containing protein [Myxococcales bacterium]|nr:FHA domain-containing protein [Myxococcales bacterium]MCB9642355.1 FHA domain-containing protein [Myxococcales bacterium]
MAEIIVKLKGNELARKKITKSPFFFGSGPGNDFQLENPAISSSHFHIVFDNFQYKLIDDSSTNGTYLNEQKITEKVLEPGLKFVVGKFTVEITDLHEAPQVIEDAAGAGGQKGQFRSTVQLSEGDLQHVLQAALQQRDKAEIAAPPPSAPASPYTHRDPEPSSSGGSSVLLIIIGFVIILLLGIIIGKLT